MRAEWSKGWAYTAGGAYADATMLTRTIADAYRAGRRRGDDWDWALATLNRYDPYRVFSNAFLDVLLPSETVRPPAGIRPAHGSDIRP